MSRPSRPRYTQPSQQTATSNMARVTQSRLAKKVSASFTSSVCLCAGSGFGSGAWAEGAGTGSAGFVVVGAGGCTVEDAASGTFWHGPGSGPRDHRTGGATGFSTTTRVGWRRQVKPTVTQSLSSLSIGQHSASVEFPANWWPYPMLNSSGPLRQPPRRRRHRRGKMLTMSRFYRQTLNNVA